MYRMGVGLAFRWINDDPIVEERWRIAEILETQRQCIGTLRKQVPFFDKLACTKKLFRLSEKKLNTATDLNTSRTFERSSLCSVRNHQGESKNDLARIPNLRDASRSLAVSHQEKKLYNNAHLDDSLL